MNLDDLRKKARGGDLEPEPDKPCDFEGCENFASYKDEEGKWCHTHRVKMIRETVSRGVNDFGGSSISTIGFTGFTIATCAISPSVSPAMPFATPSVMKGVNKIMEDEKKKKKKSKLKKVAKNVKDFGKGFIVGIIEDEARRPKK